MCAYATVAYAIIEFLAILARADFPGNFGAPAASGHGSRASLRAKRPATGTAGLACRVGMPGLRYLYPTRSISLTASAWSAPAAATSTLSALNDPQAAMNPCGFAAPLAGYS